MKLLRIIAVLAFVVPTAYAGSQDDPCATVAGIVEAAAIARDQGIPLHRFMEKLGAYRRAPLTVYEETWAEYSYRRTEKGPVAAAAYASGFCAAENIAPKACEGQRVVRRTAQPVRVADTAVGRLFHTPEERAELDRQREEQARRRAAEAAATENGRVTSPRGQTIWINGVPHYTVQPTAPAKARR